MKITLYKYNRLWHLEPSPTTHHDATLTVEVEDGSTIEHTSIGAVLRLAPGPYARNRILLSATALHCIATRTALDTPGPAR